MVSSPLPDKDGNSDTGECLSRDDVVLHIGEAAQRMGDRDIYLEISRHFAVHLPQSVESLQAALDRNDGAESTRLAHSLKGNCAAVGADGLREDCLVLERLCREGNLHEARAQFSRLVPKLLILRDMLLTL